MFPQLTTIAAKWLEKCQMDENERSLYLFGLDLLISSFVSVLTSIFIGIWMEMLLECIAFQLIFIPLRSYSGGYHAKGPWACYFLSNGIIAAVLLLVKLGSGGPASGLLWAGGLLSAAVVCLASPVDSPGKPLDEMERRVYAFRARVILLAQGAVLAVSRLFGWTWLEQLILWCFILMALTLLAGMLSNHRERPNPT